MIKIEIPGRGEIKIEHVVFDVNGTLALDGELLPGVPELLEELGKLIQIHLLTADTHGKQNKIDQRLGLSAGRVNKGNEPLQKAEFVKSLNGGSAAIGQGANDSQMIKEAEIGICILSPEGSSVEALLAADIIAPDILSAINLLLHPKRLVASLRK
jgi:P-type E1-E2 ATPase